EWVHVQLHQQKGMISLSPPTICNSASYFIMVKVGTSYVPINVSFSPKVGPGLPGINRDTRIYLFCEVIFRHRYLFGAKCVG
ncbi:hypothetical protein, partial [Escherichia coli]